MIQVFGILVFLILIVVLERGIAKKHEMEEQVATHVRQLDAYLDPIKAYSYLLSAKLISFEEAIERVGILFFNHSHYKLLQAESPVRFIRKFNERTEYKAYTFFTLQQMSWRFFPERIAHKVETGPPSLLESYILSKVKKADVKTLHTITLTSVEYRLQDEQEYTHACVIAIPNTGHLAFYSKKNFVYTTEEIAMNEEEKNYLTITAHLLGFLYKRHLFDTTLHTDEQRKAVGVPW